MTLAVAFARVMILKNGPGASKNVDGAEVSFRASESGPNDAMTGPAVEEEYLTVDTGKGLHMQRSNMSRPWHPLPVR